MFQFITLVIGSCRKIVQYYIASHVIHCNDYWSCLMSKNYVSTAVSVLFRREKLKDRE